VVLVGGGTLYRDRSDSSSQSPRPSDRGQTALVGQNSLYHTHPHITVSWVDGAKAKESNEMLSQSHTNVPIRLAVECRIEFKLFHN